jgi:hypothetical protein
VELVAVRAGDERASRLDDDDEVDGAHEEAVDDVADRAEAAAADGPAVHVEALRLAVDPEEEDVGANVEDGVDAGRDEREREGGDGSVHLQHAEAEVGDEARIDGYLDLYGRVSEGERCVCERCALTGRRAASASSAASEVCFSIGLSSESMSCAGSGLGSA